MGDIKKFHFDKKVVSVKREDYKDHCDITVKFEPREIELTEFQKLIVECKPEINKPVIVLSGAGSGKTTAINERSKIYRSGYVTNIPKRYINRQFAYIKPVSIENKSGIEGYDEYIYERINDNYEFIGRCRNNKVIGFFCALDFIENIAPIMKGEYTIISGYNIYDNPHLIAVCPNYEKLLKNLCYKDKRKYMGYWSY